MLVATTLPGLGGTYLDNTFLGRVQRFISEASTRGVRLTFNDAFRPPGTQAIRRGSRTAITPALPGSSLHEAGFAVDVNFDSLGNIPGGLTGDQQRQSIRDAASAAGLAWGGQFTRPDRPHFYYDPGGNREALVRQAQETYRRITGQR